MGAPSQERFDDEGDLHYFSCHRNDCAHMLNALLNASRSARCAFYDLDTELIHTSSENTSVLVYEKNFPKNVSDSGGGQHAHTGEYGNIEPVTNGDGLMHHKFCIFNNDTVLTGTWNPTTRGTYANDNSIVLIRSEVIAGLYRDEYRRIEGSSSEAGHPRLPYQVNLSGTPVTVCFSPRQKCEQTMIEELETAKHRVRILAFMFTSDAVGETLMGMTDEREVEGVFEAISLNEYSEYEKIARAGGDVIKDSNPAFMHEKMMIVDNRSVMIGSYNPTKNARENNDENLLIIRDDGVAAGAGDEYARVRREAEVARLEQ